MSKRSKFEVTTTFTYSNGMTGGICRNIVNSRKQAAAQLVANREWCAIKHHTVNTEEVKEV